MQPLTQILCCACLIRSTLMVFLDRVTRAQGWGGGGKGGSHQEFTNNNFAFHESRNKYLLFHATKKYRSYKMSKTLP